MESAIWHGFNADVIAGDMRIGIFITWYLCIENIFYALPRCHSYKWSMVFPVFFLLIMI